MNFSLNIFHRSQTNAGDSEALKALNFGGAKGDRTPDLYAASVALSQLSYGPILIKKVIINVFQQLSSRNIISYDLSEQVNYIFEII